MIINSCPPKQRTRKNRLRRRGKFTSNHLSSTLRFKKEHHLGTIVKGGNVLLLDDKISQQYLQDFTSIKGSLAMEGLILSNEEEELILYHAQGLITDAEFNRRVMELINNE